MTLLEYVEQVDDLRQRMPERPTREQWAEFFREALTIGPPQGGVLEAYQVERDRPSGGLTLSVQLDSA